MKSYPVIDSPNTVDFMYELNNNFNIVVTNHLDQQSRVALMEKQDPATMLDSQALKIRKAISNRIYGKSMEFFLAPDPEFFCLFGSPFDSLPGRCGRRGLKLSLCCGERCRRYSSYTLLIWLDSEPTKLLYFTPKRKPRRGGGLR